MHGTASNQPPGPDLSGQALRSEATVWQGKATAACDSIPSIWKACDMGRTDDCAADKAPIDFKLPRKPGLVWLGSLSDAVLLTRQKCLLDN